MPTIVLVGITLMVLPFLFGLLVWLAAKVVGRH